MFVSADGISGWSETSKLVASDAANYDYFGYSVSISGSAIVVGAFKDDTSGLTDAGYQHIYLFI